MNMQKTFPNVPAPGVWMDIPQEIKNISGCPPGLEYLSTLDQLLIHQELELFEIIIGFETRNKYSVKNIEGKIAYFAVEIQNFMKLNCYPGNIRPFDLQIFDQSQNEVIHVSRSLRCASCFCPCCLQIVEVMAPPDTLVGTIVQEWSIYPRFLVKNAAGDVLFRIKGPFCQIQMWNRDLDFQIFSNQDEEQVGKISKQWSGFLREFFTDADYFGISFPVNVDVKTKAVFIGACFLIDFMYFEQCGRAGGVQLQF